MKMTAHHMLVTTSNIYKVFINVCVCYDQVLCSVGGVELYAGRFTGVTALLSIVRQNNKKPVKSCSQRATLLRVVVLSSTVSNLIPQINLLMRIICSRLGWE